MPIIKKKKCNPFLLGEARNIDKIHHVLKISYSLTRKLRTVGV